MAKGLNGRNKYFFYVCPFCGYYLPKVRRLKNGGRKDNYNRLVDHWIGAHLDEYCRLMNWIDSSCPNNFPHSPPEYHSFQLQYQIF